MSELRYVHALLDAYRITWKVYNIGGVCSVAGTLLMTSMPTSRLSTKMVRSVSSPLGTGATFRIVVCNQRGHPPSLLPLWPVHSYLSSRTGRRRLEN